MSAAFPSVLRKPPAPSAFYAPSDLSSASLIHQIITVAGDLLTTYSNRRRWPLHQHQNARSLLRRIQVLLTLFEFLLESERPIPRLAKLCLHEFYIIVHRARFLLDYFFHSSRLWLLLHTQMISCHFHELEHEISILLDVLPLNELCLSADVLEHVELVGRQVKNSRFCIDVRVEELRVKILSFLSEFEEQRLPDLAELKITFLDRIGILDARNFDSEIKFLEEQIYNSHESEAEADSATIAGVIAVARYAKLLLFGIHEAGKDKRKLGTKPAVNCISIPNDFCCPISLELMSDPVVVSTGQTYDRNSIAQWISAGHKNCPNSGQTLVNSELIPNQPMRILISQWCAFNSVPCSGHGISSRVAAAAASKATMEATRAISRILIQYLSNGDFDSKKAAAGELRLLAKIGKLNRVIIAEEGAIPLLSLLLNSGSPIAQANAVGALLNLSIHDANKRKIIIQEGCLASIVTVLRSGLTPESRENAAAALVSLSTLHEYKKLIVDEPGGAEALGWLLKYGSTAGKKDAVRALFNLSMHPESWERMVNSSAVGALVGALEEEKVAEAAAGARGGQRWQVWWVGKRRQSWGLWG
ncbi:U-box domain-containing protein 17-like [Phalaenopsis equestris]|uniref:U-box domain-containing protein 17-like n=1 Tax=Phalaenopsis equestris TaxID=78828 RepID=UPI0009E2A585|nr:U-box domain-containing protein 17-like [Phalaenopsis equestris]